MKSFFLVCLTWFLILWTVSVFSGESTQLIPPLKHKTATPIYIINHGGHAGIVIKRSVDATKLLPERAKFPNAKYLEIGWGDRDYYQAPDPHIGLFLKAALLPSSSVLHIVGFNDKPVDFFLGSEIVRINLTKAGMEKLMLYIGNSFARNKKGLAQILAPGLYNNSYFYLSRENYHMFKTCNVWIAKALQSADIPVIAFYSLSTDSLMAQLYEYGEVVNKKSGK